MTGGCALLYEVSISLSDVVIRSENKMTGAGENKMTGGCALLYNTITADKRQGEGSDVYVCF